MHPRDISINEFNYPLPEEKIAVYPLTERDASKLLIYQDGVISEDRYANIASFLPEGSLLLFNDTKVVEARLLFQKPTGGTIEIFCLEPAEENIDTHTALRQRGSVEWQCLVGGASKWKHGQVLERMISAGSELIRLEASFVGKKAGSFIIRLSWTPGELNFAELLHHAGAMPLPPYIKRKAESGDNARYQTIYAEKDGSVAAPTAGLHFTDNIFAELQKKNISRSFLTLHVGAGTFKPVKSETLGGHDMHAEFIDVAKDTIVKILKQAGKPIIPVGTTSLRTLESLYWLGVKLNKMEETGDDLLTLGQWEAYELEDLTPTDALGALLNWMERTGATHVRAKTQLLITSAYRLRLATALITNFHQPQSTLLLLITAFVGKEWRRIYDYALEHDFRFLSYGDGCLLFAGDNGRP